MQCSHIKYKELERIIKTAEMKMGVDEVIKIAKTITGIRVNMPENRDVYVKTLFLTERQKTIEPLFELSAMGIE